MPRPGRFTPAGFPTACFAFLESSKFSTQDKIAVVQLEAKACTSAPEDNCLPQLCYCT